MRRWDKKLQRYRYDSAQHVLVFHLQTKANDSFESKCFMKKYL